MLPVKREGRTGYLYFGDRWCYKSLDLAVGEDTEGTLDFYCRSTYVVLPVRFDSGDRPYIVYEEVCPV